MLVKLNYFMVFHSARKVVKYPVLVINNTPIERVTNFNYLGLQLSYDLNWDKHKSVISLKLTKTIGVLRVRVRVRKIYFDNEKHDIEETNTETFMCRSMSATNAYTKL